MIFLAKRCGLVCTVSRMTLSNEIISKLFRDCRITECSKILGEFCACFIRDISQFETSLIERTLNILRGKSELTNTGITVTRDRDLLALASFILKHSDTLKASLPSNFIFEVDRGYN